VTNRDVLLAEVGAAFGILGLLLVFLPLALHEFDRAVGDEASQSDLDAVERRAWAVAITVALAAVVATLALLALWLNCDVLAVLSGIGLLVLTWCVVILAGMAVWTR
jgi:hypothetical protein